MSEKKQIPEVDIVVDHEAGVIREVKPEHLRSKSGHEKRINGSIYAVLILISIIWLAPFVFLVFQSFRSYATESGAMPFAFASSVAYDRSGSGFSGGYVKEFLLSSGVFMGTLP